MKSVFVFLMLLIIQPAHSDNEEGCAWTKLRGRRARDSFGMLDYTTLERCRDECAKHELCVHGFDWGRYCLFDVTSVLSRDPDYDHYACLLPENIPEGADEIPEEGPTRAPFVAPTEAEKRACEWKMHKDKQTFAYNFDPAITTFEQCLEKCITTVHCEVGFNWFPADKHCHITMIETSKFDVPGSNYYSCEVSNENIPEKADEIPEEVPNENMPEGACEWTMHEDKQTLDFVRKEAFTTLAQCKEGCLNDPECDSGIDWFENNCYFSTNDRVFSSPGNNHYFCSLPDENNPQNVQSISGKACDWTSHKDKQTINFVRKKAFTTLAQCMEGCLNDLRCDKGIDWFRNSCYFSTNDHMFSSPGNDYYSCSMKNGNNLEKKNCKWRISPGTYAKGSKRKNHVPFWDCVDMCLNQGYELCAGVDSFSPLNNQRETCNFHGKDTVDNVQPHKSSVHVAKDCGCRWKYEGKSGQNYHYLKLSHRTLETCKGACLEDVHCQTGIHWDSKKQKCYFGADLTSNFENWSKSYVHKEFDHYLCEF